MPRSRARRPLDATILVRAEQAGFRLDDGQRDLARRLGALGTDLLTPRRDQADPGRPRGLYVHGPAGRGKTWVADAFYAELPTDRKSRVHFHGFFDRLHRRIHAHRTAGDGAAVTHAIDEVVGDAQLLLFDEFHVHDSGNAQLLTRLLEQLFRRDLTVVATSNYAPDDLLPHPLWHHTVEDGIALVHRHMDVHRLDGPVDYRTLAPRTSSGFGAGAWQRAGTVDPVPPGSVRVLDVGGRRFPVLGASPDGLWISFDQLCRSATSTIEYLAWASQFRRWVITDIPGLGDVDAEARQRFANVVDVLVDSGTTTTFVSAVTLASFIASAGGRPDDFRMTSRLRLLAPR